MRVENFVGKLIGALLPIVVVFFVLGMRLQTIEDGEAGVRFDFGKLTERPLDTGWYIFCPLITSIERWNVKTQEIKETANVPSSEGLISSLDVSVIYNVPKDKVVFVRRTLGRGFRDTLLEPYVREAIRNIVSGYEVKALYSDKSRAEIGNRILAHLKDKLEPRGFTIQDVLLRDVRLPPTFSLSIESKLKSEQESLQKQFELTKAQKDAEIEVARAQGVAQSNKIISASLDENYLRYQWILGLQKNNAQVIYVPTEGNIPIMEASRFKSGPAQ